MKFHETHFEEYIQKTKSINLHPKLNKVFDKFPKSVNEQKTLFFWSKRNRKILSNVKINREI